jgi:hypothetical protein
VNALLLYHDLKERGVLLEADDDKLLVDAPAGELTDWDKAALAKFKPVLLEYLSGSQDTADCGRQFDARPSRHPGYTSLYNPVHDEWLDFPTRDCYPSIVELARKNQGEGGA